MCTCFLSFLVQASYMIGIVRQFSFSSALQRMSVVVRQIGERRMDAYLKGAPEVVASLCKKESGEWKFRPLLSSFSEFKINSGNFFFFFFFTTHHSTRGFCRGSGGLHQTGFSGHRAGTQTTRIQTYISQSAEH